MNTIAKFAKIAKLMSVTAIILVISPFIYAFTAAGEATVFDILFSLGAPALFIALGYALQTISGKISGYQRKGVIFEDEIKYFEISAAILPVILSFICSVPVHMIYKAYRISREGWIDMYDLDLYLVPVVCSLIMILGVILWFLPYHKLIHREMIFGYGALLLGDFVISLIFGVSTIYVTVATIIFLAVFFIVSNIRSIEEALSVSKFRVPSNNFRSYNIKLTLKHYVVTIVSAIVVFSIVFLLVSVFNPDISLDPEKTVAQSLVIDNGSMASEGGNGLIDIFSGNKTPVLIFSYLTVAITVIAIIMWFVRQKKLVRKFIQMIKMVFAGIGEFIEFLFGIFERDHSPAVPAPDNYVDREIECFTDYREISIKKDLDYKSFTQTLESKETLEEKYAYAYSVYTRLIRGHKYGIKASDTPRMLTAKLSAVKRDELNAATPVFEDIKYRVITPDKKICEEQLKELIALVRQTI